ncbi:MAG: inner membrane protein YibH [Pseudomonadota bacterium]|jgi:HlyD family secretion protein
MNKRVVIPVVVLIVAGIYTAGCSDLSIKLGIAKAKDPHVTLYGNVDIRQVELGFRVAGRIAQMKFEEGESVTAGTKLAELDARSFQDTVRGAEAEVARRTALLARFQAGSRPAEIEQAKARVSEVTADLERARQDLARQQLLVREGASAEVQREHAAASFAMATARLESTNKALQLTREGARREDIAEAKAGLAAAEASLSAAQTSLADSVLSAPSDGVILSRVREPGAIVGPSDIVFVLSLLKPVWVRAYVAEPLLGRVSPGMEVSVFSDTKPGKAYKGRIGFISPVAEFTPKSVETPELRTDLVYRMRVIVEDADQGLRQDMPVTVRLPIVEEG